MKSVTMVSFVFTLSFCLNLVAGKNLPYKTYLLEVEDNEDNNADTVKNASKNADGDDFKITAKMMAKNRITNEKGADIEAEFIADNYIKNHKDGNVKAKVFAENDIENGKK